MATPSSQVNSVSWSADQLAAITHRGEHILVSAAAGSGKTAVLVERIIRRITDETQPIDIDRLLVATFTNAAAAEMKHRIREALEKELVVKPQSAHVRKQLALMGRATITTIHSFCLEVVRKHVDQISLDPRFRIANETEIELLKQELLEELLEEYYGEAEEQSYFWRLVDAFSGDRNDHSLVELVQKLYRISQSHPWPETWLRQMAGMFSSSQLDAAMIDGSELLDQLPAYNSWQLSLVTDCNIELEGVIELLEQALAFAMQPDGPVIYEVNLKDELAQACKLLEATRGSWSDLHLSFQQLEFAKLKSAKGDLLDPIVKQQAQELRKQAKDQLMTMKSELFGRTPEQFSQEIKEMAPIMHTLVDLIMEFDLRFKEAKITRGIVDFSDLEHYCLHILSGPGSSFSKLVPSQPALDFQEQFVEILLDEYQDTNRVQETIMALISRTSSGNRFMVGDVKQSIYRFRLAEPGLFQEKSKTYTRHTETEKRGLRIDLARNYRSREPIVNAVNFIFKQIMNETVGEVAYDQHAELVFGAAYEDLGQDHAVEVMLIDRNKGKQEEEASQLPLFDEAHTESEESLDESIEERIEWNEHSVEEQEYDLETAQLEARAIASRIHVWMNGDETAKPFQIWDKITQTQRTVTYRDIVILIRATKQWAPIFIEELSQRGIPAYADLSTGYFHAVEVEVMLSLLKIIDNPIQDIPLASVLRSALVGLSSAELARIRAYTSQTSFYLALVQFEQADHVQRDDSVLQEKLHVFMQQLENWRNLARQGTLSDLIWNTYRQTGYYDHVGGLPGGQQRQANLRALYDRARQYESTSLRGLFRFLRFIERMQESGGDLGTARAMGEQENVVRIMTIHKSKGLEFPVVCMAGLAKRFNQRDVHHFFLIHKDLGFGPRFVDTDLRVSYPTLPLLAIKKRMKLELLAEEMRVLYVAMTRAKEKLLLVGTVQSAQKSLKAWSQQLFHQEIPISNYKLSKASSFLDWIGPTVIRHTDANLWRTHIGFEQAPAHHLIADQSQWSCTITSMEQLQQHQVVSVRQAFDEMDKQTVIQKQVITTSDTWKPWFDYHFTWTYPHLDASHVMAKTTVSEIKRLHESHRIHQEEEVDVLTSDAPIDDRFSKQNNAIPQFSYRRPRFIEQQSELTAAERGTIIHAVMQNISIEQLPTRETVQHTLQQMMEKKQLTQAQREAVNIPLVLSFFQTALGQRMIHAPIVNREVPFSYGLPASEVYRQQTSSSETVLIQGVIDCMFEDEHGLVIVDYKTDATKTFTEAQLKARYQLQIALYTRAVEHILKKKVAQAYLYYFDGAKVIRV